MAERAGVSEATVRRIWRAHGLKPHLSRTFKVSTDPKFAEKLTDIVGLYLNPPEHANRPNSVRLSAQHASARLPIVKDERRDYNRYYL